MSTTSSWNPLRVLHVFQDTVIDPRHHHLGSTKGIRCRTDYFLSRGIPFDELVTKRQPRDVLRAVQGVPLNQYSHVVFEHSHSPAALRWVRRTSRRTRVVLSAHNAEFFHRLDILRANGLRRGLVGHGKQLLTKTARDVRCGRLADVVVTVSEWEAANYWRPIVGRRRARYMPWHMPQSYLPEFPVARVKDRICLCLLSTIPNPLLRDAARHFTKAVEALNGRCGHWTFVATGDAASYGVARPSYVQWTGVLETPYPLLARARAMALLSDLGYGFKTKILEAILTHTYVILTPGLYRKLPAVLRPYCIVVQPGSGDEFAGALEKTDQCFPTADVNTPLRNHAFRVLDDVFGVAADE